MDKINSWCKLIALVSILSSVFLLVLPESKSKKVFKSLLSLILIYTFVSPLTSTKIDFSSVGAYFSGTFSAQTDESYEEYKNYPIITASESELERYFNDFLSSLGIEGECEATCEFLHDKIVFKELKIAGVLSDDDKEALNDEVKKIGDENTLIYYTGEEYG